jgi:hypothetical protein
MTPSTIAFEADVLVAALAAPGGTTGRLLQLAALGLFKPVIAPEALAEAERHARTGVGGRVITEAELLAFRAAIGGWVAPPAAPPDAVCSARAGGTSPAALWASLLGEGTSS